MTPKELLVATRDKIASPDNWTDEWYALDSEGNRISGKKDDREAVRWDVLGAMTAILRENGYTMLPGDGEAVFVQARNALQRTMGCNAVYYGKHVGHLATLARIDETIATL